MEREQWIDDVLNSTKELKKMSPRESLLSDIKKRVLRDDRVDTKTVFIVAASIVLLIAINLRIVSSNERQYNSEGYNDQKTDNPFSDNNQLY